MILVSECLGKLKVLEYPGMYLWFKLTNMHSGQFWLLLTETN